MKIEYHNYSYITNRESIDKFADRHGLVMVINHYHGSQETPGRFCAYFKSGEIRQGTAILASTYGIGSTEDEAIADYVNKISNQLLIVNATGGPDRREIRIPKLVHKEQVISGSSGTITVHWRKGGHRASRGIHR